MSLANHILPSWQYDFGENTSAQLTAQAAVSINTIIAQQKTEALNMIASGAYGPTNGTYRVIARADANSPTGYTIEVRQVTT